MNNIKHAVILAGGLGKRVKSIKPNLPKEMLPIGGKPAIQYAIEEIECANIINAIIIINKDKDIIIKYLSNLNFAR